MSLIQAALDRASEPEEPVASVKPIAVIPAPPPAVKKIAAVPKPVPAPAKPAVPYQSPRLNTIRYYETENKAVETAIQEKLKEAVRAETAADLKVSEGQSRKNIFIFISVLLFLSFLAARYFMAPAKTTVQTVQVTAPAAEKIPQPVIVKTVERITSKPIAQAKFLLTGITASSDDTPLAVINNQVVGTGDRLREGAIVKSITGTRVVLELDSKQIVLNF